MSPIFRDLNTCKRTDAQSTWLSELKIERRKQRTTQVRRRTERGPAIQYSEQLMSHEGSTDPRTQKSSAPEMK